jgi:hypothetical protein
MSIFLTLITAICFCVVGAPARPTVVVVVGAPGAEEYAPQFQKWSEQWRAAAGKGGADFKLIGSAKTDDDTDRGRLQKLLADAAGDEKSQLWLVMIGHGTYDRHAAKFNLRGPDLEAADLAEWVKPLQRPVAVINCASASAPFINRLAGENRVVISATKSGDEQNFSRFGQYISGAIADPAADLDKDGQTSLLEAYLNACRQVAEFYEQDARLATEHALLDDNGDGLGTPAAWFRGLRSTQRAKDGASLDGTRAHQWHLIASDREQRMPPELRGRRDALELKIATLRAEKPLMADDDYYRALEPLMVELARLYDTAGNEQSASKPK